jgi:hypothetical protein
MRRVFGIVAVVVAIALFGTFAIVRADRPAPPSASLRASEPTGEAPGEEGSRADPDFEEEQDATTQRLEALEQAQANGTFGDPVVSTTDAATGWLGSRLLNAKFDDWEPAVAADPNDPYVYLLTTRYGDVKTCSKHCPTPYLAFTVSDDGGKTWGAQHPLCVCRGSGAQYDPTIEVVPNTGDVVAVFLNADRAGGFSTVYMRSTDHGATWTDPVHVYGHVSWTDKPEVTTSASGRDVYVSWNGPQGGDMYIGQSHDFGRTWTQQKLTSSKVYYYAYDARVLSDGTVVFSESGVTYSGSTSIGGAIQHVAVISRNRGATWRIVVVARVAVGEACVADGCSPDFYTGQTSVVEDRPGTDGGPQRVYVKRSSDEGRTWGAATRLSFLGENATGPRLASSGGGDVRIWYMQTANHDDPDAWNVWYRSSSDGGATWSSPVKLNDAPAHAAGYTSADGFDEIYGDYGEIAITNEGKTVATWGEGYSWTGPGGTWFNVQR